MCIIVIMLCVKQIYIYNDNISSQMIIYNENVPTEGISM